MEHARQAADILARIRGQKPLVHQITNFVVMTDTANVTLCLGALPVMAHAIGEAEEMCGLAGALVLNIGTLSPEWTEAMALAGRTANRLKIPVVLDPVGAGATRYRTETCKHLLGGLSIALVRGNLGEMATLADIAAEVRGVESAGAIASAGEVATVLARKWGVTAAVTGPVDVVSDGERVFEVSNGHPLLGTVTGTGCSATAAAAAFAAVEKDIALAAASALACFGLAAELAAPLAKGPASFKTAFHDALYNLDTAAVLAGARIRLGR
jgi:hydroxyethylthiazole kinase